MLNVRVVGYISSFLVKSSLMLRLHGQAIRFRPPKEKVCEHVQSWFFVLSSPRKRISIREKYYIYKHTYRTFCHHRNSNEHCRGDWGTLRRKNSNPPNTDLIFQIKYFDDTYGYSIQWGISSKRWKLSEMCNLTFFNKTDFQKSVSMYPVLGHLETPHGVPWDTK